ncbi:MAG: trigger factor [Oscillospiraceae bacterium]|jgi:trigger factor|nr:trigger factor [Oscillospiraceae bacterium]MCI9392221.1 trigger factor [Oscillospiraceae bacterium]
MSVKSCETLEKSMVALTVEVGAADFEAAVEKAYRKQRGSIRMPGFRPGKAPRKMIERMYGEAIFYEEAVNAALPDAYGAAVKEKELQVVGYPQVELLEVGKEGFSFKATVAVYPQVTLGQYKGIEAPKAEVKVLAADVNARLKEMADRNSRMVSVERKVKKGDVANIDFEGFMDGVPFDGGKSDNFDLEIGSGQFVPGFEDQIIGMEIGEEKDLDITFPEDYHADLAGKSVVFHVKVNAVKVKETPALDDEFAKDVSEFDTLAELKKDVKAKLTEEREEAGRRAFEDVVMNKVAEGIQADIPDAMVEEQAHRFVENLKMQVQSQGIPFEQYMQMTNMDEEKLLEEAMGPAVGQVRMDLAVTAIVKEENIEVSDEEVEAEIAKMAEQYGMDVERVKQFVNPELIKEEVARRKAVSLVVDSAVAVKPEPKEDEGEEKKKRAKKESAGEAPESAE